MIHLPIVASLWRDLVPWIPVLVIIIVLRWVGIGVGPGRRGREKIDD